MYRNLLTVCILCFLVCLPVKVVLAQGVYTNGETNYEVYMDDQANLLTATEELDLLSIMEPLTEYTSVCLVTTNQNNTNSPRQYAMDYYYDHIGTGNGTVFLIDMDNRELLIYTNGEAQYIITASKANSIADNVYRYASNEEYYKCCAEVFTEEYIIFSGDKINQPMKHISNGFLAVILGLILNYFFVKIFSQARKPSDEKLMEGLFTKQNYQHVKTIKTHQTKTYSPQSSGSGGSSGGGSSGGGGGSSGGHSF